MLWERRACKAGTTRSLGPREAWAELSFCPRRWAHAEGCSNSSDRHAQETRSSVFWSPTGSGCTCKVRQRQARVRGPSTSETKFRPLSGQDDTLNHFKRDGLLLAEELPAVPAVVTSLGEGEANGAAGAAVHHLILHPVVGCRTTRLVADGPAEDSTTPVTHKDLTVVPVTRMNRGGGEYLKTKEELVLSFGRWFFLLGDGEGCDLSWLSVVLAIKRSVHGEFAPEHQLALPSVPCRHPEIHIQTSWSHKKGTTKHQQMNISVCGVFCEATASVLAAELRSQSELLLWKDLKQSLSAHLFWVGYSVVRLRWTAEKAAILSSGLD